MTLSAAELACILDTLRGSLAFGDTSTHFNYTRDSRERMMVRIQKIMEVSVVHIPPSTN